MELPRALRNTNITLRRLRAFVHAADQASFTRAAGSMSLTQSALSLLIKGFEQELGVRLFDRHARRVTLTDAGKEVYPLARRVLNDVGDVSAAAEGLRGGQRGVVRVGCPVVLASTHMPLILARFKACRQEGHAQMLEGEMPALVAAVASGDIDFALGPDAEAPPGVAAQPCFEHRQLLVCESNHALARHRSVRWADLRNETFIAPTGDFMPRLVAALAGKVPGGLGFGEILPASTMFTAIGMTGAGLGVTVCPAFATPIVRAFGLQLRQLLEPICYRELHLYMQAQRTLSPLAQALITDVRAHFVAAP